MTPTYNQSEYLDECVESVLDNLNENIEYIIVNDGSTDETSNLLKKYEGIDNLKIFHQDNIGQVATLNKYWSSANSKYLTYLSSDDILVPGSISELTQFIESDCSIDVVYPDFFIIDSDGKVLRQQTNGEFDVETLIGRLVCQPGPLPIFRKSIFDSLNGWKTNLRITPDHDFWIRACRFANIARYPKPLAYYRWHIESQSTGTMSISAANEVLSLALNNRDIADALSISFERMNSSAHYIAGCNHYRSKRYARTAYHLVTSKILSLIACIK